MLTFQPTTVVLNAQQVLQFGLTAMSLIVMVATVLTVAAAVDALQAKSKTAMVIAVQNHGLAMAIAMTAHTYGTETRSISTVQSTITTAVIAINPR